MFKVVFDFFGYIFLLFLLLSPIFLPVGAFLIWKGSGKVRVLGWLLLFLAAYYRFSWISPRYVIKGSELVQEYKFKDIPFQYIQDYSVRWIEASHRLVILPSSEVLYNPKSAYYTHLLAVDVETRQTYWLPTDEVDLDKTINLESLGTGYGERRDGLSLYYASPSKQEPRVEFSSVGFSLPILFYKIRWIFSETSGWQWEKTYFAWERKVVYKSDSSPSIVELNQITFNRSEEQVYVHTRQGSSAWVMEGKFLIVDVGSRVLVLGPFIASQDTQSKDNKRNNLVDSD